jgi:HEAT repeat protein
MRTPSFSSSVLTPACLLGSLLLVAGCSQLSSPPPVPPAAATPKADTAKAEGAFDDDDHPLTPRESLLIEAKLDEGKLATIQRKYLGSLLDQNSTQAAAQEAAQKLGLVLRPDSPEGASALAVLAPMLVDPLRFDYARLALDPVPGATVDALYLNALPKAVGRARLGLIDSIGARRIEEAVPALTTLLTIADDTTVTAVAQALGRIGGPAALKALDKAKDPLAPVVLNARLRALTRTEPATAAKVAGSIYRNDKAPLAQRAAALRSLIDADPAGAVEEIHAALAGREPKFQAVAIESVATLPIPVASASLASRLGSYAPEVQVPLMAALGHRHDTGAIRGLLQAVASDNDDVRLAAIDALGRLPGSPEVAGKLAALAVGNSATAKAAAASLTRLNGPGVDEFIFNGASNAGEIPLRVVYVQQLAARNQTEALPFLLGLRSSPVDKLRLEALDALALIASPAEQPALIAWATGTKAKGEQNRAVRALITLLLRDGDEANRTATVIAAINTGSAADKITLFPVLSRVAGPAALATAGAQALSSDEAVATAATAELTRWPDSNALPVLVDLSVRTAHESVRASALQGAIRHLSQLSTTTPEVRSAQARSLLELTSDQNIRIALLNVLGLCADEPALQTARKYLADPATAAAAQDAIDAILSNQAGPATMTASHNSENAGRAVDNRPRTFWETTNTPGEWLRADLHHSRPVRKITLEQGNREWDFPEAVSVQLSDDPDKPGDVLAQLEGSRYRTVITLPAGARGRYLWIRQTATRSGPWTVSELIVE